MSWVNWGKGNAGWELLKKSNILLPVFDPLVLKFDRGVDGSGYMVIWDWALGSIIGLDLD